MVGLSLAMKDSNVDAPIRSPAAAKTRSSSSARRVLTAPASEAAPAAALPGSSRIRPWKSLVARTWTVSTSASGTIPPELIPMISGLWSELRNALTAYRLVRLR